VTRTNVRIYRSTAFQLHVVKLDSLPTFNCYSILRGLKARQRKITALPTYSIDRTASAILLRVTHTDLSRTHRANGSPCSPPGPSIAEAEPQLWVLQSMTDRTPSPRRSALTNISPPTASEINGLAQSLPIPRASSKKLPNPPSNSNMAFLTCLHKILSSHNPG
jgi:hypothetical protein